MLLKILNRGRKWRLGNITRQAEYVGLFGTHDDKADECYSWKIKKKKKKCWSERKLRDERRTWKYNYRPTEYKSRNL